MAALEFVVSCPELACAADEPPWQFVGADKASVGGFLLKSIAITHRDNAAPQFSQNPSGSLFEAGGVVSGLAAGRFEAVDSGSGIHRIRLVVDGVEMPVEQLNSLTACAEPFVSATPCPPIVAGEFSFDTARLPDGLHTVQLEAFDATGTSPSVYGPLQIRVENFNASGQAVAASGLVPNGSGASRSAKLRGIGRSSRSLRRQKSDRPSTVIGRLVNDKGAPISGAALRVFAAVDVPGAKPKLMAGATTGRTGRFSFEIPPGASRRVDVRYRAFSTDDKDAASWQFRVAVPAPVKLMSSRPQLLNTQKLTLTAHLSGARIPARSADAAFQVRIGKTWRTFATRPFNEQGLARVGHRFRVTFHRLTYRFRVLTLRRRTFPFANAHSRPVAVQVN